MNRLMSFEQYTENALGKAPKRTKYLRPPKERGTFGSPSSTNSTNSTQKIPMRISMDSPEAMRLLNEAVGQKIPMRISMDSPEAMRLLNEAVGSIASAKIEEELAKNEYKETKKYILESFAEKVMASKEELNAIVKVAEAKAKDKVLYLDNSAQAVLKVLEYDTDGARDNMEIMKDITVEVLNKDTGEVQYAAG